MKNIELVGAWFTLLVKLNVEVAFHHSFCAGILTYVSPSLVVPTEDAQLTPLLRLGAGACAGIIAMSATYPLDMVRGRLTVQV
jgi:hypothetical protein